MMLRFCWFESNLLATKLTKEDQNMDDVREVFLPLLCVFASIAVFILFIVVTIFISNGYFFDKPACERYSALTDYETDSTLSGGCLVNRGIGDWVTLDSIRSNKIEITERKSN